MAPEPDGREPPLLYETGDDGVAWRSITYRELWDWITQVAMGLRALGIRDGDRVCIMSRTRAAWLVADIATQSVGAVSCRPFQSTIATRRGTRCSARFRRWRLT